jgi:4-hydroxyacetophenone monooxygenase
MTDIQRDDALRQASVPTLLMCLAQITRDPRWLQEPFLPKRDISIFAEPTGGLSEQAQQTVRDSLATVLDELASGQRSLPPLPTEAELVEMMSVCLGERVPSEYAPMAMEEMGFRDRTLAWRKPPPAARLATFRVLVIGAGFTGLCAAYRLKQMGFAFEVVEKNPELGGTWFENHYPEAGVDTPNHFYSYSFAPNTGWSSNYSKRDEMLDYQRKVAADLDLRRHIDFGVEVLKMDWHEDRRRWEVTTREADGSTRSRWADAVITAMGFLNRPKLGSISGIGTFTGPSFHSARWRDDVPLQGKRIGVIGTGASAMQFLRSVAAQAAQVTIFQRSPQWARPPQDYHGTVSTESKWLLQNIPYYYAWYRFGLMWRFGDGLLPTVRRDPNWPTPQRSMNHRNDRQRQQLTEHLLKELEGRPDLIDKCLPDYPPYGKRILIDNGWYQALKRPNVELVTEAVDHVEGSEIVDATGRRHEVDVILLATGFEPGKLLWPIEIRGRKGLLLSDVWADDQPRAHLGITMPGFPNLFVTTGPNTGLAHGGSAIFVSEVQVRYITAMLREMFERSLSDVEVLAPVHDAYNERVDAEHAELVWTHPGMRNWYRNAQGRVFAVMPWRLVDYWQMTHEPDLSEFKTQAIV